jgi:iron-sulfur cluster repair protein YtfE (RIC family)
MHDASANPPTPAPTGEPSADTLDRVSTATLVTRLLLPQHAALRASLAALHGTTTELAPRDPSRSHVLRRAATMLADLSDVLLPHLAHEEADVFPALAAGTAPAAALGEIHDHHGDIDERLLLLRGLTAELLSPAEVTEDTVHLFEGLATFIDLAQRHHHVEDHILRARAG